MVSRRARTPTRGEVLRLAATILFFCAAPVAGDIGSCSQPEDDLDPAAFFADKKQIDCAQCEACGLTTNACARACSPDPPTPDAFP
ncbi:MAG TPA: hypothetical protein VHB21_09590, partial [Minicystis sp.]|nr:hypothetical protein [Minicystis sp.]